MAKKAPHQVTPGVRYLEGQYVNDFVQSNGGACHLGKEIYGMQLDSSFLSYDKGISYIKNEIQNCFGEKIKFLSENIGLEHHGWFVLQYYYIPHNYTITFESEFNGFDISITNEDGGFNSLSRLTKCSTNLTKVDVKEALICLQTVLNKKISFYKRKFSKKK